MTTELAIKPREDRVIEYVPSVAVTLEQAKENMQRLHQVVRELMEEGTDYGKIPGTPKPTLLKPGAEKLLQFYGLGHRAECVERIEDWDKGFFYYRYRVEVFKTRPDGRVIQIASCEGSANSKERRYRNQDVYTIVNTLQKMAIKRALVGAALQGTGTSGLFTQDLEDVGVAPEDVVPPIQEPSTPRPKAANGKPVTPTPSDAERPTAAQHRAIAAIAKRHKLSDSDIEAIISDKFGVASRSQLSKSQASELIDYLQGLAARATPPQEGHSDLGVPVDEAEAQSLFGGGPR